MKKILLLIFVFTFICPNFVLAKKQQEHIITPQTQLQKRQFQTRTYAGNNKALVMKAMLNVLQDEGFIVYNANPMLGFISGVKDFDTSDKSIDITKEFGTSRTKLAWNGIKVASIDVTANVTEYGNEMKVRVNFKRKLLNVYGNPQSIDEVNDEKYYQEFFAQLDKNIFIEKI